MPAGRNVSVIVQSCTKADTFRQPAEVATLLVQGTTQGAGLTLRSLQLVRDYGLDEAGWHYEIGNLEAIISTVDERIAGGDWLVTSPRKWA